MSIEHIILGIISLVPCSGYDMKIEAERGSLGMLSALGFGSIYPRLKQLLIEHLRARREESIEVVDYLTEWQKGETAFIDEYGMLVLTYIKNRMEAEISWIALAIVRLEGPPELPVQDTQWLAVLQKARRTKALEQETNS